MQAHRRRLEPVGCSANLILIWRTLLADKQTQINQESHYTDLFTKAIESLGATRIDESGVSEPVIETRIGAIFVLERLAKHSRSDYNTIIETLSAYIREQCGKPSCFKYTDADPDEEGIPLQDKESRLWDWCRAQRAFRAITTGHSNRRRTQTGDFENIEIPFPPTDSEQRALIELILTSRQGLTMDAESLQVATLHLDNVIDERGDEQLPEVESAVEE